MGIVRQIARGSVLFLTIFGLQACAQSKTDDSFSETVPQFLAGTQSALSRTELKCGNDGPRLWVEDAVTSESERHRRFTFDVPKVDSTQISAALSDVFDPSAEIFLGSCFRFERGYLLQMLRVPNLAATDGDKVVMDLESVQSSLVLVELRVRDDGIFVISQIPLMGQGDPLINPEQETSFWPLPYGMPEGRGNVAAPDKGASASE